MTLDTRKFRNRDAADILFGASSPQSAADEWPGTADPMCTCIDRRLINEYHGAGSTKLAITSATDRKLTQLRFCLRNNSFCRVADDLLAAVFPRW